MTKYVFDEKEINAILQYLAMKPYAEVVSLISLIKQAAKVEGDDA